MTTSKQYPLSPETLDQRASVTVQPIKKKKKSQKRKQHQNQEKYQQQMSARRMTILPSGG